MALKFSLVDDEMLLRWRIFKLCGSADLVWKIMPAGVKAAHEGEERFVRENGLSPEEHAARVRLIPGLLISTQM